MIESSIVFKNEDIIFLHGSKYSIFSSYWANTYAVKSNVYKDNILLLSI